MSPSVRWSSIVLALALMVVGVWWFLPTEKLSQPDMIQTFMALGPTNNSPSKSTKASVKKCIPCGERNGKLPAGSVPSGPPRKLTDPIFQAITGRDVTYQLPHEIGTAPRSFERPTRGWITMLVGPPLAQFRCHAEIDHNQIRLSRWSDASFPSEIIVLLSDPVPTSVPSDAVVMVKVLHRFFELNSPATQAWSCDQEFGDLRVVSVAPELVVLVPNKHAWQSDHQQDVQLRLTPTGHVTQFSAVNAHHKADGDQAYRVLWFPEYDTP